MRKKPLLSFTKEYLSINIILDEKSLAELRGVWENRVDGIQLPLVEGTKNGLFIHIPWMLKEKPKDEKTS